MARRQEAVSAIRPMTNMGWLFFTILAGGLVHTLACWLALQLDFFRGNDADFYQLFSVVWGGNILLLAAGATGLLWRFKQDTITLLVLGWSTLVVLVSAFFVDQIRLCIMVFFFAIVQAGVFHASRNMLITLGIIASLGYLVSIVVVHTLYPSLVELTAELSQWAAFTLVTVGALVLAVDITTLRHAVVAKNNALTHLMERVRTMATHDELTGLYNRRYAMERIGKLLGLAERNNIPLYLAYLDLDHFKQINDTYGHAFGDQVLSQFAELLQNNFTGQDFAARIGGEEFLLILVNETRDQARTRLDELRKQWQACRFPDQPDVEITMSAGLGACHQQDSHVEWIARVDRALYQAKQSGRNRLIMADSQPSSEVV